MSHVIHITAKVHVAPHMNGMGVISHLCMSHGKRMNELCHTSHRWNTRHTAHRLDGSHVTHVRESWPTYKLAMSYIEHSWHTRHTTRERKGHVTHE